MYLWSTPTACFCCNILLFILASSACRVVIYRFRGFVANGGGNRTSGYVTLYGVTYWQVQTARLAFVVVFEVRSVCVCVMRVCKCEGRCENGKENFQAHTHS